MIEMTLDLADRAARAALAKAAVMGIAMTVPLRFESRAGLPFGTRS